MRKHILFLLLSFCSMLAVAQQVTFDYDAMGNRIKRQYHAGIVRIVEEPVVQMRSAANADTTTVTAIDTNIVAAGDNELQDSLTIAFETIEAKLYPNPTSGWLQVAFSGGEVSGTLEVVNLSGQVLQVIPLQGVMNKEIDLSAFPAGSYFVRVHNQEALGIWEVLKF